MIEAYLLGVYKQAREPHWRVENHTIRCSWKCIQSTTGIWGKMNNCLERGVGLNEGLEEEVTFQ